MELGVGCEGPSWAGQNDGIHGGRLCVTLLTLAKPVGLRARCSQGQHRQWQALFAPKAENDFSACKGELSSEPEGWEGGFIPQHLAEQTQLEMPPGKDGGLNNPYFIWEGCLSSQGYVFRLRCSLFLITIMKLKIASAQHPRPHT